MAVEKLKIARKAAGMHQSIMIINHYCIIKHGGSRGGRPVRAPARPLLLPVLLRIQRISIAPMLMLIPCIKSRVAWRRPAGGKPRASARHRPGGDGPPHRVAASLRLFILYIYIYIYIISCGSMASLSPPRANPPASSPHARARLNIKVFVCLCVCVWGAQRGRARARWRCGTCRRSTPAMSRRVTIYVCKIA